MKLWNNNRSQNVDDKPEVTMTKEPAITPASAKELIAGLPEQHTNPVEFEPFFGSKVFVLNVKHKLAFDESLAFVDMIRSVCINEEDSTYHPELFDFAVRLATIQYYGGLNVSDMDTDDLWRLAFDTNCYDSVNGYVSSAQLDRLVSSAREHIRFYRDMFVSAAASKVNDMMGQLMGLMDGVTQTVNDMKSPEMQGAIERLAAFAERTEGKKQNG